MSRTDLAAPEPLVGRLHGAPLDALKLAAAVLMLGDHVNTVVLGGTQPALWLAGRIAFPLFCLVVACHLLRGAEPSRYLLALLVVAVPTQPIFAWAFNATVGNILLTLAAGIGAALAMRQARPWMLHLLFATAAVVVMSVPLQAKTGVDFGLAGMMLPAAMAAALLHRGLAPWAILFVVLLNATPPRPFSDPWWWGPATDGLAAVAGAAIVTALALTLRGRSRFLPRYALYLFYPAHLAALALVRDYWST